MNSTPYHLPVNATDNRPQKHFQKNDAPSVNLQR